ncbi:glycosyltransferase involved in cell wall biosynthesis [Anoxybacillus tepidamans]|uniref:Glycosyltransferase involved in cell wall biosynthesis n=1 Tax=Anoxybacteroides tepidamans TaxID=265948 RepID=A0A7W8IPK2_9BACL|nr:glycosyltransferase family 2 protein [Anoxybacillus tepidamans]MBB5324273.1 glycosyltransferase involved in cell wall biosynthesis [Anoxybacillus tepidamans]
MKPFLSLCMIVKNEEKVLQRCLDSVYGIVDEIVIVDTGSTDSTKDIALKYTKKVYDFEWTNSFADARNFAQQQATGEWILVLDADEYVERANLQEMIDVLKQTDESVEAYDVVIYNFMGVYGERVLQHRHTRIYRNSPHLRYVRAIHEQLRKVNGEYVQAAQGILTVYHTGYMHQAVTEKKKHDRNAPLLEYEMEVGESVAFDYFNLGNEYLSKGEIEKALESFIKAYQEKKDIRLSWVSYCLVQIILCLKYLQRFEDALQVITDAENLYSETADFPFLRGEIYYLQYRYDDAAEQLEYLLQNKNKYPHIIKTFEYVEYDPHMLLGHIYKHKGNLQKAMYHYSSALSFNRRSYEALYHVLQLLARVHREEEIIQFIENKQLANDELATLLISRIASVLHLEKVVQWYALKLSDETIRRGFEIKINILQRRYEEALQQMLKSSMPDLQTYIRTGSLDSYDLLVLALKTNQLDVIRLLLHLVSEQKEKEFLLFIMNEYEQVSESTFYLLLLERTIQLKEYELFEQLLALKDKFAPSIHIKIGHLLHRYEFMDVALQLYRSVENMNDWDAESFVNVIEALAVKNEAMEAMQYGLLAISFGHRDFRLYKYVIELMNICGMSEEKKKVVQQAKLMYPDSQWLKEKEK